MADNVVALHTPEKPEYLKPNFVGIPNELKLLPQWVVWRAISPKPGKLKWAKIPYLPSGKAIPKGTAMIAWGGSFDEAVSTYTVSQNRQTPFDGIGFVFTGEVGPDGLTYCSIDFDKITFLSSDIVRKLNTYTETSVSGIGVHCITLSKPYKSETCNTETLTAEIYCEERYFAFTGQRTKKSASEIIARPHEVGEIITTILREKQKQAAIAANVESCLVLKIIR